MSSGQSGNTQKYAVAGNEPNAIATADDADEARMPISRRQVAPLDDQQKESLSRCSTSQLNLRDKAKRKIGVFGKHDVSPLREMIRYAIFLFLFNFTTFARLLSSTPNKFHNVVDNRFLPSPPGVHPETNIKLVQFEDVATPSDVWEYLNYTLLPALEPDEVRSGEPRYDGSYMLGIAQFIQKRIQPQSCKNEYILRAHVSEESAEHCYPSFTTSIESRNHFGNEEAVAAKDPAFQWSAGTQRSENRFLMRPHASFGHGGYMELLHPGNISQSQLRLTELHDRGWIDLATRALFVDFTLYNSNEDLFCFVRISFLMPAVGGVESKADIRVSDPYKYDSTGDIILAVFEIVFMLQVLNYMIEEMIEFYTEGISYWYSLWNYIDILNLGVFALVFYLRISSDIVAFQLQALINTHHVKFIDYQPLAYSINQARNLNAFNAVLVWLKMFKYLSISPKMSMFTKVLANAAGDILVFLAMFAIVYLGFAQAFYIAFHVSVSGFRSMAQSFMSLFRSILGDFDFRQLEEQNWLLGPLLFLAYIFLIFFVLLNMFLAILNDSYTRTLENLETSHDPFTEGLVKALGKVSGKLGMFLFGSKSIEAVNVADTNQDHIVDMAELTDALRKQNGISGDNEDCVPSNIQTAADQIMKAYDQNADGVLDESEQWNMNHLIGVEEPPAINSLTSGNEHAQGIPGHCNQKQE